MAAAGSRSALEAGGSKVGRGRLTLEAGDGGGRKKTTSTRRCTKQHVERRIGGPLCFMGQVFVALRSFFS